MLAYLWSLITVIHLRSLKELKRSKHGKHVYLEALMKCVEAIIDQMIGDVNVTTRSMIMRGIIPDTDRIGKVQQLSRYKTWPATWTTISINFAVIVFLLNKLSYYPLMRLYNFLYHAPD